jgi:hypothetical protein
MIPALNDIELLRLAFAGDPVDQPVFTGDAQRN